MFEFVFPQVCDDQYKVALVGTLYMVGLFFGSLLGSYPADRLGRKPMIFAFVFVAGAANLVSFFFLKKMMFYFSQNFNLNPRTKIFYFFLLFYICF